MIYGIIPARLESTRLPRKMLLSETGKPLIQHTWEAVQASGLFVGVIVATDSEEIADTVREFGGRVQMTGPHESGTARVAEVASRLPTAEVIVNIQGDHPEIDADTLRAVCSRFVHSKCDLCTLSAPLAKADEDNPNVVKVRYRPGGVPDFCRVRDPKYSWRHHVGVYGFRADSLQRAVKMPATPDETAMRLEQMRWIGTGLIFDVVQVGHSTSGIDTPEDYAAFVERVRNV